MSTATGTRISYRKTKTGEWVAYGPAATLRLGTVTVTKANGSSKTETVTRLGREFTVDGVAMVYGYLQASRPATSGIRLSAAERGAEREDMGDYSGRY